MTKPVVEAYELLAFAQQTAARLVSVAPVLESRAELPRERAWLESAVELLSEVTAPLGPLMERGRQLPELKSVRLDQTGDLIATWVDALEKLLAGFTFHLGSRHPIIQAVFTNPRFPQLRRAAFEVAEETASEVDRRLRSSYVERMLSQDDFAFARPVVEQVRRAWDAVRDNQVDLPMSDEDQASITRALVEAADLVELALKQARLIAEAALLRSPGAFEDSGLDAKAKKRTPRAPLPGEALGIDASADYGATSALPSPARREILAITSEVVGAQTISASAPEPPPSDEAPTGDLEPARDEAAREEPAREEPAREEPAREEAVREEPPREEAPTADLEPIAELPYPDDLEPIEEDRPPRAPRAVDVEETKSKKRATPKRPPEPVVVPEPVAAPKKRAKSQRAPEPVVEPEPVAPTKKRTKPQRAPEPVAVPEPVAPPKKRAKPQRAPEPVVEPEPVAATKKRAKSQRAPEPVVEPEPVAPTKKRATPRRSKR